MSKWLVLLCAALACVALACGFTTPEATRVPPTPVPTLPPGAKVVNLRMENFTHETAVIEVGTVIIWTNHDQPLHTTTHIPTEKGVKSEWDSKNMAPDTSFRHYFDKPGVYGYNCLIHPVSERGTITVVEDLDKYLESHPEAASLVRRGDESSP